MNGRRLRNSIYILSSAALLFGSCRKENGIDNNNVISTPYSVYFSDFYGDLYNTNDGVTYKTIFPSDGYIPRAIVTSGPNIIWVKKNVHLSENNGLNFNPTHFKAAVASPWQSIILDVPDESRVYLCSDSTGGKGIVYSEDHGKTWSLDTAWDPAAVAPFGATSLAELKSNHLFNYDGVNNRLWKRTSKSSGWAEVTMSGLTASTPANSYFITRFNNTLVATDRTGVNGVLYSSDEGATWTAYTGLPAGVRLESTGAPLDLSLLVGTDSAGIYRLENGSFSAVNNGLAPHTTVYAISGKEDIYKNQVVKQYIYIATSTGLYQSQDGGTNWIQVMAGDIHRVY